MIRDEQGAASVLAVALVAVLVTAMTGGAQVGAVVLARHQAQSAADLSALAAAAHLPAGSAGACNRAQHLARAMDAFAVACSVDGLDIVVTVQVLPAVGGRWTGPATAVARAGPASENN